MIEPVHEVELALSRMKLPARSTALLLLASLGLFTQAHAQQILPLSLQDFSGSERLVIYAGIDGSPALPYLFDTGSSAFNAAYFDGTMASNVINQSNWSNDGTNVSDAHYDYSGGFGYKINEVNVHDIEIYDSNLQLKTTLTNNTGGFTIGQATERINAISNNSTDWDYMDRYGNKYSNDPTYISQLSNGLPPEPPSNNYPIGGGLYGTFGAGLFADITSNSPAKIITPTSTNDNPLHGDFTNGSVLGQANTNGWAVVANNGTNRYAILGLNSAITNQFTTAVPWLTNSTNKFPNSGANSGTEFDVNFNYSVTKDLLLHEQTNWQTTTLLDTGTQDNTVTINTNTNIPDLSVFTDANNSLKNGVKFTAQSSTNSASSNSADIYSFTINTDAPTVTDTAQFNPTTNGNSVTLGIGFFLSNSVAFDLANSQVLYTPNVVTVPEPSSYLLFALGGFALLMARKRKYP